MTHQSYKAMARQTSRQRKARRRRIADSCRRGYTVEQAARVYKRHISHVYRCILEFAPKKRKRKGYKHGKK